jgi:LPXTG-site transpeptidase (sortase) family protein
MYKYTSLYINVISLFISILIFIILNFFISNWNSLTENTNFKVGFEVKTEVQETTSDSFSSKQNNSNDENEDTKDLKNTNEWYLEIPSIELKAPISEGTSREVMDEYIGHFEETPKLVGNIGLAAHNRGYKNNYFSNIKNLKEGDEIDYYYKGEYRKYIVKENFIISDTDWTSLENTEEDIITLITCVENEPNYRRCVQAQECTKAKLIE